MAHEVKVDNVRFDENPLKFCQAAYEEANKRNKELRDRVIENRAFFDGEDDLLELRSKDPNVKRSSLFIHESRTAIETRWSSGADRLEEDATPVKLNIDPEQADVNDEKLQFEVKEKTDKLNSQMEDFFRHVYEEWFMAAEKQPLSVVKVGWEEDYEWKAQKPPERENFVNRVIASVLGQKSMPLPETKYAYELINEAPIVEWLDWDEFLYPPYIKKLQDAPYLIHRQWVSWNELCDLAKKYDWSDDALDRLKPRESEGSDEGEKTVADEVAEKGDDDIQSDYRKDKILLCEFWVRTYNSKGEIVYRTPHVGNNKVLLDNPLSSYKGLRYPFRERRAWRKQGVFEGIPSVELVKDVQRAYSDIYNSILDAVSMGIWKVILKKTGNDFNKKPIFGPGRIWELKDISDEGIRSLLNEVVDVRLLIPLIDSLSAKIRQILNAPDFNQAVEETSQEKATKTRLRAVGALRRLRPLFMSMREDIVAVAEMFIALNQQHDPSWILPVTIDVPVLAGVNDPAEELSIAMMLWEKAMENPLYQDEAGLLKMRELWVDVLNAARIKDIDRVCPTEEDIQAKIQLENVIKRIVAKNLGDGRSSNELAQIQSQQPAAIPEGS